MKIQKMFCISEPILRSDFGSRSRKIAENFNIEIYGLKSTKHVFSTRTLGITASNLKYLESNVK